MALQIGAKDILTVTVNPALDVAVSVRELVPDHKLKATHHHRHPGGGGVNVSRGLRRFGIASHAWVAAGGAIGQELITRLEAEEISVTCHPIVGQTREAIAVRDETSGQQYRVVVDGPAIDDPEAMVAAVATRADHADVVVLSGYLAPGLPDDFYARILRGLPEPTISIVDCDAGPLSHAISAGATLVKPSERELSELLGRELRTNGDIEAGARDALDMGPVDAIVVSLGADGALLADRDRGATWFSVPPVRDVLSTVGSGDAMVAGIVAGLLEGENLADACRRGVAAGTAAALTPGTELSSAAHVRTLLPKVGVR